MEEIEEKLLDYTVFPSDEKTITVETDDTYGGAHVYFVKACKGFNNGKTEYVETDVIIPFVKKLDSGEVEAGLQSEQLVYILLDRAIKLNNRFPSAQNEKMITGLQMFLDACRERVEERLSRGVMGELKK